MPIEFSNTVQKVPLTLGGSFNRRRSNRNNYQDTANWYLEIDQAEAKHPSILLPSPGSVLVKSSIGNGIIRGGIVFKDNAYFIIGSGVYKMDQGEIFTQIGTITTTVGTISMASSDVFGNQFMFIDLEGQKSYYSNGSTITQITDVDYPATARYCTYIDGFFIVSDATGKFWQSDSNDAAAWNALNFATAESDPDDIQRPIATPSDLYLVGEFTVEIWTNGGSGEFPWVQYQNGTVQKGTPAPNSVAIYNDAIYYLSKDRSGKVEVIEQRGLSIRPLSNSAISLELEKYSDLEQAHAYIYSIDNHTFYQITFPVSQQTWACDLTIENPDMAWARRTSFNGNVVGRHFSQTYLAFNNKHYVGHSSRSDLYRYSLNTYTDNGYKIVRERIGSVNTNTDVQVGYFAIEIECDVGHGLTSGQGSDPHLAISWSDDYGKTWSNARIVSLGKLGEYSKRVRVYNLGQGRGRIFKVTTSDPVFMSISHMWAYVEVRQT